MGTWTVLCAQLAGPWGQAWWPLSLFPDGGTVMGCISLGQSSHSGMTSYKGCSGWSSKGLGVCCSGLRVGVHEKWTDFLRLAECSVWSGAQPGIQKQHSNAVCLRWDRGHLVSPYVLW